MVDTDIKLLPSTWEIILLWTGANILSIFGGILLGAFLNDALWSSDLPPCIGCISITVLIDNPIQRAFIFGLSIGSIKGLLEWLVLQRYKAKWNGWIPVSLLGWAVGVTVATGLPTFRPDVGINQLLGGLIIGLSQWIVLQRYFPPAHWWIIASVIGSFAILSYVPLGFTFSMMLESFIAFVIAGIFIGVITGAALSWFLALSWLQDQ